MLYKVATGTLNLPKSKRKVKTGSNLAHNDPNELLLIIDDVNRLFFPEFRWKGTKHFIIEQK